MNKKQPNSLKHDKKIKRVANPGKTFKFTYGDLNEGFDINSCKYKNSIFIKIEASRDCKIKMQSALTETVIKKQVTQPCTKNHYN